MRTRQQTQTRLIAVLTIAAYFINFAVGTLATTAKEQTWHQPKIETKADIGSPGKVAAASAILMEVSTGRILYQKQAYKARPQASTTKITTGILALEHGKLEKKVKASKRAADTGESGIWLEEGEELTLGQLTEALMIYSANDAAVAIAEKVGGTYEGFIEQMNAKAKSIGCVSTHYVNPHGLDEEGHYSSAYDLALLARYGLTQVPGFKELIRKEEVTIPWEGHEWERVLHNRNLLIGKYQGADGVKTGYTEDAGKCVVASATRGNEQYIAVVLDSPDRFAEAKKLLDYGFAICEIKIVGTKSTLGKVQVKEGYQASLEAVLAATAPVALVDKEQLTIKQDYKKQLTAPVKKGQVLGYQQAFIGNKEVAKLPIVAGQAVKRKTDWELFWDRVTAWFSKLF